jgi:hypothetical protein
MKPINKNWEPCPRCESKKVRTISSSFHFLLGLITMSFGLWFLMIPPIGIAGIFVGLALMVISPFLPKRCTCQDCKFSWRHPYND